MLVVNILNVGTQTEINAYNLYTLIKNKTHPKKLI